MTDPVNPAAPSSFQPRIAVVAVACVAFVHFAVHVMTNGNYGMFRDEYYYLACAHRLAWGYVDHPPFSIALLKSWLIVFPATVSSIRLIPAVLGVALIVLTAAMARGFGGGASAQRIAAVAVAIAPLLLALTGFYSMNAIDLVIWSALNLTVLCILNRSNPWLWLVVGLISGIGLENKLSVLVWGFSLVVGLALTPHRRQFRAPALWLGGAIAVALLLPHVVWQIHHDWPTREFLSNAASIKNARPSLPAFLASLVTELHPLNAPIWIAGLIFFLGPAGGRRWRIFGLMALISFAVFFVQGGKVYYTAPLFPLLLAAGSVHIEQWLERWKKPRFEYAILVLLLAGGAIIAPMAVPLLSPRKLVAWQRTLGLRAAVEENNAVAGLDQHFADRFGWHVLAEGVAEVVQALPPSERDRLLIVTRNYGEAASLEYFGKELGLSHVASGHNNYALWGYAETPDIVIGIGIPEIELRKHFHEVQLVGKVDDEWAMPYERHLPIFVARSPLTTFEDFWKEQRHFI